MFLSKLCTTLENDQIIKVSTVEHLLAAFYIGSDNAIVEIDKMKSYYGRFFKNFLDKFNHCLYKTKKENI